MGIIGIIFLSIWGAIMFFGLIAIIWIRHSTIRIYQNRRLTRPKRITVEKDKDGNITRITRETEEW